MKECKRLGKIPVSMSIDTWAVDYVLLDDNDKRIGDVYGYRDERTDGMDKEVYRLIEEGILYTRTGVQKQKFNTIYQLMADKLKRPEQLEKAKTFIMLPDYFSLCLQESKHQNTQMQLQHSWLIQKQSSGIMNLLICLE